MNINNKIKEILKLSKIPLDDGICYLIALFHGYEPSYIPDELKLKINFSKIVVPDPKGTGLIWNVTLYSGGETAFEWVKTEYEPLFKERNSLKGGKVRESTLRMKKFFAENPSVRKDEVLEGVKLYLRNTDPDYIRYPHYFISKGRGVEQTSDLLDWIERYREDLESSIGRQSVTTTMQ